MNVEETIKDRDSKYGSFVDYCAISSNLKANMKFAKNGKIHPLHREALDMIFCKIARILNGDPNLVDNWHDVAGYATLVEKELIKDKSVKPEDFGAISDEV